MPSRFRTTASDLTRKRNCIHQKRNEPLIPSGTKGSASAVPPCLTDDRAWGGAEGTRTPYLNTASVALSRLSYSPMLRRSPVRFVARYRRQPGACYGATPSHARLPGEFDRSAALHHPAARCVRSTAPAQRLAFCAAGSRPTLVAFYQCWQDGVNARVRLPPVRPATAPPMSTARRRAACPTRSSWTACRCRARTTRCA
jgi:hypothetical protein